MSASGQRDALREQGCGLRNYNRSCWQLCLLRTLMKDARWGSIR